LDARTNAHSFVLRIWIEEQATTTAPLRWRGHITNVLDGERRSVESFVQVERFVREYITRWDKPAT
jgi:hypothetical protein